MAKLYSPPGKLRGPSLRGRFYVYESKAGTVAVAWPKKRGGPRSQAQADTMAMFKQACDAMKRMDPDLIVNAMNATKGTQFLPRDPLMAMLYGRGPTFMLTDGTRIVPMAERIDISQLLDNLAWDKGTILLRSTDLWIGLAPGTNGQVLTMLGADVARWQTPATPPSPGTAAYLGAPLGGNVASRVTFSAGFMAYRKVVIPTALTITRVLWLASAAAATATIDAGVYDTLNGVPNALLGSCGVTTGVVAGLNTRTLSAPVGLAQDQVVWTAINCHTVNFTCEGDAQAIGSHAQGTNALPATAGAMTSSNTGYAMWLGL